MEVDLEWKRTSDDVTAKLISTRMLNAMKQILPPKFFELDDVPGSG